MNYKFILLIFASMLGLVCVEAQTLADALRFSQQNFDGTARSAAMGSLGALGGDFTSASTNPAGLGIYRNSEWNSTLGLRYNSNDGGGISDDGYDLIVGSAGVVWTQKNFSNSSNFKNLNFAIGYQQMGNFNRDYATAHEESSYSFLDRLVTGANGYSIDNLPLDQSLAYKTYLISPLDDAINEYTTSPSIEEGDLMYRRKTGREKGSMGETTFSFAGNFNHQLYFGATLGIQSIDYRTTNTYYEQAYEGNLGNLDEFFHDEYLYTRGIGTNFKLGLIYRVVENFRVGVAAHTPTFYSMEDEYQYAMESFFGIEPEENAGTNIYDEYPNGSVAIYEYSYRTPWKFIFSGGYIFDKIGAINVDYELVDYSSMKYSGGEFGAVNSLIGDTYTQAHNLRVGAEVKANKAFSIRAGINYQDNTFASDTGMDNAFMTYSGGLGYRHKAMFCDLSYQYRNQEMLLAPQQIDLNADLHTVKFTIGAKF